MYLLSVPQKVNYTSLNNQTYDVFIQTSPENDKERRTSYLGFELFFPD